MIALPANWRDGIQLREWLQPVADEDYSQIAVLVLLIRNTDGVVGFYQPVTAPSDANEDTRDRLLSEAYGKMIDSVPGWAQDATTVTNRKGEIVPITDTIHGEYLLTSDLSPYSPIQKVGLS